VSDGSESSLYDELGVDPGASGEELRAGYRRQARSRHPDVAGGDESSSGDAMRRLNEAWAVLGDPERRRRYDESRAGPGVSETAEHDGSDETVAVTGPRLPFVRPSALVLVVLAIIFVVTAYAGTWPGSAPGSSPPSTNAGASRGAAAGQVIGQCVATSGSGARAGALAGATVVPCSSANDGQILAEVTSPAPCPAGTVGDAGPQPLTILCVVPRGAPAP
jgi:DnaJ domain